MYGELLESLVHSDRIDLEEVRVAHGLEIRVIVEHDHVIGGVPFWSDEFDRACASAGKTNTV